jgi:hypothetical protein
MLIICKGDAREIDRFVTIPQLFELGVLQQPKLFIVEKSQVTPVLILG